MKLFNTLTRSVEDFVPLNLGRVNFFVCGPTVYDYSHLGHAQTYTFFDFIVKYLRRVYDVNFLVNVTDIDDKIILRAKERNIEPLELARFFEAEFFADMSWLKVDSFTTVARAHDFVDEIVSQVSRLIDQGYVYRLDDGWYYDLTRASSGVGVLSGRVFVDDNAESRLSVKDKRNSGDFVVWKFAKPGEPFWVSPFGDGRPGWHIEDTAITEKVFGEQYDVHGGATDLIFPHHEAEILQMESLSKKKLANYWVHSGLLQIKGQKMAKSSKNFITIKELQKDWEFETVRFFFLSNHYRSTTDFEVEFLKVAKQRRTRVENFYRSLGDHVEDSVFQERLQAMVDSFYSALDDDLNTPEALSVLFQFIRYVNGSGVKAGVLTKNFLDEVNLLFSSFDFSLPAVDDEVLLVIHRREELRGLRMFSEADLLRDELSARGIVLEDTVEGTVWYVNHTKK